MRSPLDRALPYRRSIAVAVAVFVLWLAAVLSPVTVASAQSTQVGVGVTVSADRITVGDVFAVTLTAIYPPDYHIVFPMVEAKLGELEVVGQRPLPVSANDDGRLTSSMLIEAVAFTPGVHSTPPLSVAVRHPDGRVVHRAARRVEVTVESVLSGDDDVLRDIKPQAEVPVPLATQVADAASSRPGLALISATVIALLAALVWWRLGFPGIGSVAAPLSPMAVALGELDRIERLDLPAQRQFRKHYELVADCLRGFISGQFGLRAMESTTTQTTADLDGTGLAASELRDMVGVLEEADLVKFARLEPEETEAREIVPLSRDVVMVLGSQPEGEQEGPVAEDESGGENR